MSFRSKSFVAVVCIVFGFYGCKTKSHSTDAYSSQYVKPGVGLGDCYLGMPIKQLKGDWTPDAATRATYLNNPKEGIGIKHDGKIIEGVFVYFDCDEYGRFSGQIEGGIGPDTSIEDVIRSAGQPANIAVTKTDDGEHTHLWYIEKGIDYDFRNKRLSEVTIGPAKADVPPELKEDIGDTKNYREIHPR